MKTDGPNRPVLPASPQAKGLRGAIEVVGRLGGWERCARLKLERNGLNTLFDHIWACQVR